MKTTATLSFILAPFVSAQLPAYAGMDMSNMDMSASQAKETEAVGVVDEIDAAKGTVTISHEAIKSLGWSAMTMPFTVKDKKMLGKLAKGKKVHFSFVEEHGDYVIAKVK